eukprot:272860_1
MLRLCKSIALIVLWALVLAAEQTHNNNWVVIVCTSRFWFNYRHVANALSVYYLVKQLGIPDSNIILMLADDMPCNARNPFPGQVFHDQSHSLNIYGEEVEVDYRGGDVTVENFIKLLSGRTAPGTPASKRLLSDENSNVLIYMSGHGGERFLKFQDSEEIHSKDIAFVVEEMHLKHRYHEMLIVVDTCEASTLFDDISSPNVVGVASSTLGENSYSHTHDDSLGFPIMDRFTRTMLEFFEKHNVASGTMSSKVTLNDLFSSFDPHFMMSTPIVRKSKMKRKSANIPVADFWGGVIKPMLVYEGYPLL